ncbi:LuxR C-terminal-related transcriptional regulator [Kitasatospora purpeofusca]|uniref:response regulator transcription factor n=1 Tax=Kitasatospora purpeofusca TaxID=67352 RepID=UPI0030F36719
MPTPSPSVVASCTCHEQGVTGDPRDLSTLTERQATVLLLLATGLGNVPIANRLGITERTVKKHVTTLLDKLRVTSRVEAALIATRQHDQLCRTVPRTVTVRAGSAVGTVREPVRLQAGP